MRVHFDPHTGQVSPTGVPMLTFASPGPGVSPACGRADSPPTQSPHGSPAATPGGGSRASGAISPHTNN